MTAHLELSEQTASLLQTMARQTGKSEDELIHEAIEQFTRQFQEAHRVALLRQARGMWQQRDDLPPLATLRAEMDRE
jgi:predicted transcriptional regulator